MFKILSQQVLSEIADVSNLHKNLSTEKTVTKIFIVIFNSQTKMASLLS